MAFLDDYIKRASNWIDDINVFGDKKEEEVECEVETSKEEVQVVGGCSPFSHHDASISFIYGSFLGAQVPETPACSEELGRHSASLFSYFFHLRHQF